MEYDYRYEMEKDIRNYIEENKDELSTFETKEDLYEYVYDKLWVNDSVTGNASGSYTFNTWKAEEYISHNWDLLQEVCDEFGTPDEPFDKGAEYWDVSIRCYLLGEVLQSVLDDMELEDELEEDIESMDLEDAFKYLLDEPCHDMEDKLPFD